MVRTALRDIRAVDGVTGVTILRKRDGYTERIFPAAFSDEHFDRLYEMLVEAYRHLRGFSYLIMTFERVTVHLFNQNEFLLLATTLPDNDQRVFEMVVKSKFPALERILDKIPIGGEPAARQTQGSATSAAPLDPVLQTLNLLSDTLIAKVGRARTTRCWWEARKSLTGSPAVLSLLTVDPNGHWAVRKGKSLTETPEVCRALAEITGLFLAELGTLQTLGHEILSTLLHRHRSQLESSGFLHYLKAVRPGRARARR